MDSLSPLLSNDHLDLLVSAATAWGVIASPTRAALAQSEIERELAGASGTQAGQLLRQANSAARRWLAEGGKARFADHAAHDETYSHRGVETSLAPVEVIKAAQAADAACRFSPDWADSLPRRLLTAIITAASHRLPGYADAPWLWTRPRRRRGVPIGVRLDHEACPDIEGVEWISPCRVGEFWDDAQLVLLTPAAALRLPATVPSRPGVFVFVVDEQHDAVWQSLATLEMQSLALFWPVCRDWLLGQLAHPDAAFVEHRAAS